MEARVFETSLIPNGGQVQGIISGALNKIWKGEAAPMTAMLEVKSQVDALLQQ